jgi:hypothetical protein
MAEQDGLSSNPFWRALQREPWEGLRDGAMRVEEGISFWSDTLTIVRSFPHRRYWWARGDAIPWLPVWVHVTPVHVAGMRDPRDGDRFRAHLYWQENRPARVCRVFPGNHQLAVPCPRPILTAELLAQIKKWRELNKFP